MERLSNLESPPGLLAVFPTRLGTLADVFTDGEPVAILAGIADPGNAGTLLRSAEIFGIRSVAFSSDAVEPYNPKVVRGSMGAIFRQCLAVADGPAIVEAAKKEGYDLIAAAGDGQALREVEFRRRTAIAIGNERRGVDSSLGPCGRRVAVEQRGTGESLNAAIAGSIIFYEFSQRAKS
jgi:TrmH family RNA methyltransferase